MSYSDAVKKKINQYFKEKLGMIDYKNGWLKGDCPDCGKYKFGVNIATGRANCFSCGNKYNPLKVIMAVENLSTKPEVYKLLGNFEGIDFLEVAPEIRDIIKVKLPESFKLLSIGNSHLGNMARNYMIHRGFNIDKLSALGVGYCTKGTYSGFIIFPFYQNNKIIYFIGRRFIQMGEKFQNPSVDDFGIGKSMITYNIDSLAIYNTVAMVESITNCLTWGHNAIATLGKKASAYQISTIIRSPVKSVIIGYDDDAMADAIKVALTLVQYKRVKVLKFPTGKDINVIGYKASKEIAKNTPWHSYNDLLKLRNIYAESPINTYS